MRPVTTGIALMALLVALLGGCSSAPPIASSWSDPAAPTKPYRNLLVFGIAANARVRSAYEDNFVAALVKQGVKARTGRGLLPVGGLGDVKAVKKAVEQSAADGVILTHLVGERAQTVYIPAGSYVNPDLYGSLYPYYRRVYNYVTAPGYYANFPVLQLETNLYDVPRQKLRWSTRSATMDPGSEKTTIKEVIESVTDAMAKAGYLPH